MRTFCEQRLVTRYEVNSDSLSTRSSCMLNRDSFLLLYPAQLFDGETELVTLSFFESAFSLGRAPSGICPFLGNVGDLLLCIKIVSQDLRNRSLKNRREVGATHCVREAIVVALCRGHQPVSANISLYELHVTPSPQCVRVPSVSQQCTHEQFCVLLGVFEKFIGVRIDVVGRDRCVPRLKRLELLRHHLLW